jgi:outer membrane receptor protein involved in Fe transport
MKAVQVAVATALHEAASRSKRRWNRISSHLVDARAGVAVCALGLVLGGSATAWADQAPAEPGPSASPTSLDEVVVTGSRIHRSTDFDSPNPTTVVNASDLQNLGIVNVGAAITQLPSNISNNTPTTTGNANFFTGSTIANLRGLNPYFGSRTLTLVNTRRFVPTNQGDGVDLNFIPSILIDHVDTVTGGASAAYGSGAIAGVQNIFLNTKMEGARIDMDFQQSMHSDSKDKHAAAAFGTSFASDRGHFVIGGEWEDMDAVGCVDARSFCAKNTGFYQNTTGSGPLYLKGDDLRTNQISETGVLMGALSSPSTLFQSNATGSGVTDYRLGLQPYSLQGAPNNTVPGGDGIPIYQYTNLRAPVDRKVGMAALTFALTDTMNLNMDASYGHVETTNRSAALTSIFVPVSLANPFAAPVLTAAGLGGGLVGKGWDLQSDSFTRFTTEVKRASIGLDGKFGDSSWSWDGYYQIGRTNREQLVHDNLHNNAASLAFNVVTDPATGQPACAAKLDPTNPMYGLFDPALIQSCVPVSVFGTQALTQQQHDYLFGDLDERLIYTQQVFALNTTGTLFSGFGAGDVQAAVGYEHRDELGHNLEPDLPGYIRTDYLIQYGEPFSGDVKVDEAYVETNIPVLKDMAAAKKLEFDVAARESRYRNQGLAGTTGLSRTHNLTTWKVSGLWDVVDWFRFRGSQSRDSRAGNFRELYYGQKIGAGGLFGYCGPAGTSFTDPCNWSLEGNPDLRPEKSDTTTVGFVVSPKDWVEGLQFSVDYFRIRIKDAIQQANIQDVEDGCRIRNDPADCALITFDGTTYDVNGVTYRGISDIRALSFNGAAYTFKGLDFSSTYSMQLNNGANLTFRLLAENMMRQVFQNNPRTAPVNIVGQTGTANTFLSDNQPQPKWTGSLTSTYAQGPVAVTGQVRFVSHGITDYNDPSGLNYAVGRVSSYQVFTLSGTYNLKNLATVDNLQLFAVVDNLFNKQPPFASGASAFGLSNGNGGTNPVFFDTLGRMYRVGLRMTF